MDKTSIEFQKFLSDTLPDKNQLEIMEYGYTNLLVYKMYDYYGRNNNNINKNKKIDTDKWAEICRNSGSKGIILIAKFSNGFCLYPSVNTSNTIAKLDYLQGNGDLVKEVSDSCRKFNLKFGLFISLDDKIKSHLSDEEYDSFTINILKELCSNYGNIFKLYLVSTMPDNGKYNFDLYNKVVKKLQPDICVMNYDFNTVPIKNRIDYNEENYCVNYSEHSDVNSLNKSDFYWSPTEYMLCRDSYLKKGKI